MTTKTKAGGTTDAAKVAGETIDAMLSAGRETAEQAAKAGTDAAAKGYEKALAANKESLDALIRGYDDLASLAALGKNNAAAAVDAGNVAAKGFEAIGSEMMHFTKASLEGGIATTRAVMGAKTLKEAVDAQAAFAQASLHGFLAATTRVGEISLKLGAEVLEPVNAQVAATVEKFSKSTAI